VSQENNGGESQEDKFKRLQFRMNVRNKLYLHLKDILPKFQGTYQDINGYMGHQNHVKRLESNVEVEFAMQCGAVKPTTLFKWIVETIVLNANLQRDFRSKWEDTNWRENQLGNVDGYLQYIGNHLLYESTLDEAHDEFKTLTQRANEGPEEFSRILEEHKQLVEIRSHQGCMKVTMIQIFVQGLIGQLAHSDVNFRQKVKHALKIQNPRVDWRTPAHGPKAKKIWWCVQEIAQEVWETISDEIKIGHRRNGGKSLHPRAFSPSGARRTDLPALSFRQNSRSRSRSNSRERLNQMETPSRAQAKQIVGAEGPKYGTNDTRGRSPTRRPYENGRSPTRSVSRDPAKAKCYNCGGLGHYSTTCPQPPNLNQCWNCHKEGHRASDCPSRPNPQVAAQLSIISVESGGPATLSEWFDRENEVVVRNGYDICYRIFGEPITQIVEPSKRDT